MTMCVIILVLLEWTQAQFGVQLLTGMNYTLSPLLKM